MIEKGPSLSGKPPPLNVAPPQMWTVASEICYMDKSQEVGTGNWFLSFLVRNGLKDLSL